MSYTDRTQHSAQYFNNLIVLSFVFYFVNEKDDIFESNE